MFESMCEGLRLIADFDHLEIEKIEEVINHIRIHGMNAELTYATKQNHHYLAEIIYQVPKKHDLKADYRLRVTDLISNQSGTVHIDNLDTWYAPYSLGKILLKKMR
ncbi:MAG: hypothetical protein ACE3JN_08560 [Ectobacillus sp.]